MQTVACLEGISRVYRTRYVETHALSEIDVSLDQGDFVAVTGPSGSGKSTLLSVLGLMEPPTRGRIAIAGRDVTRLNPKDQARVRGQHIGFVFQFFHLIPDLSIEENIALPMHYAGGKPKEIRARVADLLETLDIANRRKHFPAQLSGGQKQRAAIARALANRPPLILADEPTGNLDSRTGEQVMALMKTLQEQGHCVCLATHNLAHVEYANRHLALEDGRLAKASDK